MYLLDTCVFSETQKPRPDEAVVRWVREASDEALFASAVSLGEIQAGISRLLDSAGRRRLETWLHTTLIPSLEGRILGVDLPVALAWGRMRGEAAARGHTVPVLDSLIAATALVHGLAVVTRNAADFERCGVSVVNPWSNSSA